MSPEKLLRFITLALALLVSVSGGVLVAQHPSDFTSRDKTEIFIQHLVKTMKLDPTRYRAMVLEYEIGSALRDFSPELAADLDSADFIQNSLRELYAGYDKACKAFESTADSEALALLGKIDDKALGDRPNPYLRAYAQLLQAEIDFRGKRYAKVIESCNLLTHQARTLLLADYRVCELIALSFNGLGESLLEFSQYALLLTDYKNLPDAIKKRAETRLGQLKDENGKPLQTVAGWMNRVEKLISKEVTGEAPTQKQERGIVTALDKLIELQEAVERQTCPDCGKGG